jgi:hypothetical protein
VNAGFFFAGSELTRGTLLRCWPETLTEALGYLGSIYGSGHLAAAEALVKEWHTLTFFDSRFDVLARAVARFTVQSPRKIGSNMFQPPKASFFVGCPRLTA